MDGAAVGEMEMVEAGRATVAGLIGVARIAARGAAVSTSMVRSCAGREVVGVAASRAVIPAGAAILSVATGPGWV